MQDTPHISQWWWYKQRYVTMLPALWDPGCTMAHNAIIGPEFYHWLKFSSHGRHARVRQRRSNTVYRLHAQQSTRLKLNPPPPPGGNSNAVQPGAVVPPSNTSGWSWYDVQAALPASQVVEAMKAVQDVALVYVDHPVMVVPDAGKTLNQASGERKSEAIVAVGTIQPEFTNVGRHEFLQRIKAQAPDQALQAVNERFVRSTCKALWVSLIHVHVIALKNGK